MIAANAGLQLTRQETDQYGELLMAAKDYASAEKTYNDLLSNAPAGDQVTLGDAYYGLGATALGQGKRGAGQDVVHEAQGAAARRAVASAHISDANYGVALADEQSTQGSDLDEAKAIYGAIMQNPQAGVKLQAKAMVGYGRVLEKQGHCIVPTSTGPNDFGIFYYQQPNLLFGPATPAESAEGLYLAGQALATAGHKDDAKKSYDTLQKTYATTAPDWVAKAGAAATALGP